MPYQSAGQAGLNHQPILLIPPILKILSKYLLFLRVFVFFAGATFPRFFLAPKPPFSHHLPVACEG
jgi:hypothetical protein